MNKFYIYVLLDPRKKGKFKYGDYEFNHEPFYIGKGKDDRITEHLESWSLKLRTFKNNKIKSIIKTGLKPINFKVITDLTEEESFKNEIELISLIGRYDLGEGPLTNLTEGGEGVSGRVITQEFRDKQSQTMKEYYQENPIPEDVSKKISKSLLSKNMKRSNETKRKIGEANKGRKYSDEYIEYMRKIRKGPKLSHRKNFILISPLKDKYEFLGKVELQKFIEENNLSVGKLFKSINKGIIKESDVRKVINGEKNKTINCVGWEIKKI